MKKYLLSSLSFYLFCAPLLAQNQDQKTIAIEQAKSEYRIFLQELQKLNEEYKGVTNEIKKIVAEEGVPTFDENTGDIRVQKPDFSKTPKPVDATLFGGADIRETDDTMIVTMDLPGMNKKDIKIGIENARVLKISAVRGESNEKSQETSGSTYRKIERMQGSFERRIELPAAAQTQEGARADYENGVLTVYLKKSKSKFDEVLVPVS